MHISVGASLKRTFQPFPSSEKNAVTVKLLFSILLSFQRMAYRPKITFALNLVRAYIRGLTACIRYFTSVQIQRQKYSRISFIHKKNYILPDKKSNTSS